MNAGRRGFTIIEMLVVVVLGGLILLSTFQVLIVNQRTYTAQNAKIEGMQVTRAALDALAGELREINATDLVTMGQEQVTLRAQRRFGLVCSVTFGSPPTMTVTKVSDWFENGDSLFVYADNQITTASDDDWILADVTAVDTTATCGGGEAQILTFSGQQAAFLADTVLAGAPVRAFEHYTYGRFVFSGESWIGHQEPGESATPLVGPIPATFAPGVPGVEFIYLDSLGVVTATAADVEQIEMRVRTKSDALQASGYQITDSLVTRVYLRN